MGSEMMKMVESCIPGIIITYRYNKFLFNLSLVLKGIFLNGKSEEINTTKILLHTLVSTALIFSWLL